MAGAVRLAEVRESPLSVDEVLAAVADPAAGGVVLFVGTVRERDQGRGVTGLGYTAHPSASEQLRQVAEQVAEAHSVTAVAAVHRAGELEVGDIAVVAAVACPHRAAAFEACRALIDELKRTVPVWKLQRFSDGSSEWVASA